MKSKEPSKSEDNEIEVSYSDDESISFSVPYRIEWNDDIPSEDEGIDDQTKEYRRQRKEKTEKRLEEVLSILYSQEGSSKLRIAANQHGCVRYGP